MERFIIFLFAILTLITSCILGEIVPVRLCNEQKICDINEVRVTPCKEASSNKPCKLKQKRTANIEIDFTPHFNATSLVAEAYAVGGIADLPFKDLQSTGCDYVQDPSCPIVSCQKYSYKYGLLVNKLYPVGSYEVKWLLKGEQPEEQCCAMFRIKIIR